jgi:hypothetical protein
MKNKSAAQLIDARIKELGDWRGAMLSRVRELIKEADPDVVEEWKWMGTPVWNHDGIICTGESYKNVVKMTFAKGAALSDPARLFNSSLEGNKRRAIDIHEGDKLDEAALKTLIRDAIALNQDKPAARRATTSSNVTGYLPGTRQSAANRSVAKKSAAKPAKKSAAKPAAKKSTAKKSAAKPGKKPAARPAKRRIKTK